MKTINIRMGIILFLSFFQINLFAATILTGESVRISTPIDGNVYAGAGQITIDAIVNGDVTAGTGELSVMDTIRRDLLVGGGRIRITGVIGEDLRCAGGEVVLHGTVLGDVVIGCGDLEIGPNATVHGDLVIAGGQVRVYGRVLGSVVIAGGEVSFAGEAGTDAEIRGGKVKLDGAFHGPCKFAAEQIDLGPKAVFYKEVRYWQKSGEVDFATHLQENARATVDESLAADLEGYQKGWFTRTFSVFFFFRLLAGTLLVALLVLLFAPFFKRSVQDLPAQWLNRFGAGILYLLGIPVAVIVLFITIIGIPLGLFVLFLYLSTLAFAHALTAAVGAFAWEQYQGRAWTPGQRILAAIGILLCLKFVTWIPVIGFLAVAVAVGVAFGSMLKTIMPHREAGA